MKRPMLKLLPGSEIFSARGFLVRAAIISVVFLICDLAGLREYTSFLCGMDPTTGSGAKLLAGLGLLYAVVYLAFTALVPVLLIAAALLSLLERTCLDRNRPEG